MSRPKNIKKQILQLRQDGLSYQEICDKLQCSKGTVCYHCGDNQKLKTKYRSQHNNLNIKIAKKIDVFLNRCKSDTMQSSMLPKIRPIINKKITNFVNVKRSDKMRKFTVQEFLDKIGDNPKCFLTGRDIDLNKTRDWNIDHIIPVSRGGDNSLDNAAILSKIANMAKHNLTNEELIDLCKEILTYQGYKVTPS